MCSRVVSNWRCGRSGAGTSNSREIGWSGKRSAGRPLGNQSAGTSGTGAFRRDLAVQARGNDRWAVELKPTRISKLWESKQIGKERNKKKRKRKKRETEQETKKQQTTKNRATREATKGSQETRNKKQKAKKNIQTGQTKQNKTENQLNQIQERRTDWARLPFEPTPSYIQHKPLSPPPHTPPPPRRLRPRSEMTRRKEAHAPPLLRLVGRFVNQIFAFSACPFLRTELEKTHVSLL